MSGLDGVLWTMMAIDEMEKGEEERKEKIRNSYSQREEDEEKQRGDNNKPSMPLKAPTHDE